MVLPHHRKYHEVVRSAAVGLPLPPAESACLRPHADAVVFSQIDKWTKSGFGIDTKIRYFIKSAKTNEIIFDRTCDLHLDLSQNSSGGGVLGALIDLAASAIVTATTDHIVAARKANAYIFNDIPRGKYSPMFGKDQNVSAVKKDI